MRGSRRVRAVQTYLTAERAESFLNAAAVGRLTDTVGKTVLFFDLGKLQQPLNIRVVHLNILQIILLVFLLNMSFLIPFCISGRFSEPSWVNQH